jgi:hypothetical protein
VVREDEQRAAVGSAEHQLNGPLRHVDPASQRALAIVDEDLPVGDVDVPGAVLDDALAPALGERLHVGERTVGLHGPSIRDVLGAVRDVDAPARQRRHQSHRVEVVRPAPSRRVHPGIRLVGRLAEDAPRGQEQAAVGRHILLRLRAPHLVDEHLRDGLVVQRVEIDLIVELAVDPDIAGHGDHRTLARRRRLRLEDRHLVGRASRREGIDRAIAAG